QAAAPAGDGAGRSCRRLGPALGRHPFRHGRRAADGPETDVFLLGQGGGRARLPPAPGPPGDRRRRRLAPRFRLSREAAMSEPAWLTWARELQAIAQTGLAFTESPYDIDRYRAIERLAAAMMAAGSDLPASRIAELFAGEAGYATPKVDVRGAVI